VSDTNPIVWVPTILLLLYIVPACYNDIKKREMPVGFWTVLYSVCIPITILLYVNGTYPIEMLGLSAIAIIVYLALLMRGLYQGADFWFLTWIALFLVQSPLKGNILIPISFGILLVASVIIFGMLHQTHVFDRWFVSHNLPGFPMMLPISLALILTVVIA
jgi:hypothetical protein